MSALRTKLDSLIAKTDLEVSEQQREQLVVISSPSAVTSWWKRP